MLKKLQKYFNPASAEQQEEVKTMAVENNAEMAAELKVAKETLVSQAADMQALTELVEELSAKFEKTQAALDASEGAKANLVADAKAKQLATRKAAVEAAVGTEKAEALMTATETLDDIQFNAIVDAMAKSFDIETKGSMFKDVGVAATADATKVVEESAEMKLIRAKYA